MTELRTIARHAGTVLVGQLAVMAFGVTDTIVAGRYSQQALAALSVGSAVYITVFVALMGTLQALLPTGPNCMALMLLSSILPVILWRTVRAYRA